MDLQTFLPIPDLLQMRHILCIQPHPDDGEIGCGGTVARLARAGAEVTYLTVTDGAAGSPDADVEAHILQRQRREEQQTALAHLGVDARLVWLDEPDGYVSVTHRLRDRLVEEVRRIQPDCVLTVDPWLPYEVHGDHHSVGLLAAQAAMFASYPRIAPCGFAPHAVRAIGFFFTHRPNTIVDVSDFWQSKLEAIRCHRSQFDPQSWPQYEAFFGAQAQHWGQDKGYAFAEAFKVLTPMHLHCLPFTESA